MGTYSIGFRFFGKVCIFVRKYKIMMAMPVQYIIDNEGNKVSAVIPFMEWESVTDKYRKLQNKLNILLGIQESMHEIRTARKKNKKLQTLDSFLNECGC